MLFYSNESFGNDKINTEIVKLIMFFFLIKNLTKNVSL